MSLMERKASVDVFWRSKEGFEMHLQLSGASSAEVLDEAQEAVEKIIEAGGEARPSTDGSGKEGGPSKENPPKCSVCGKKMTYREGEGRTGKPYKGFFCPDRDCEGKPVWLDS
jgi:hypothetical protein